MIALASCHTVRNANDSRRAQTSWQAFCTAHGYDFNNDTDSILDQYLDTWHGSAAEENALREAGFETF